MVQKSEQGRPGSKYAENGKRVFPSEVTGVTPARGGTQKFKTLHWDPATFTGPPGNLTGTPETSLGRQKNSLHLQKLRQDSIYELIMSLFGSSRCCSVRGDGVLGHGPHYKKEENKGRST